MLSELFESVERENAARKAALAARGFKVGDLVRFARWRGVRISTVRKVTRTKVEVAYNTKAERAAAKHVGFALVPHVIRIPFIEATLLETVESRIGRSIERLAGKLPA